MNHLDINLKYILNMFNSYVILANGGTNGDVIPLFILLKRLIEKNIDDYFYIIIKNIHENLFYNILNSWINNNNICKYNNRYELFQLNLSNISSSSSFYSMSEITNILKNILSKNKLRNNNIKYVFTNLFSLEGYVFSESINVKCIIIHPHIPKSSTTTKQLIDMLKEDAVHLYNQLFLINDINNDVNNNKNDIKLNESNEIWIMFKYFLWPVLSEHYMELRVNLNLLPIDDPSYVLPPIDLIPIVYICSIDLLQINNNNININSLNDNDDISPHQVIGLIQDTIPENIILPIFILNWLDLIKKSSKNNIICFDFGSMTDIITHQYSLKSICNIVSELSDQYSIIIVCHNNLKFIKEFNNFKFKFNNILIIKEDVIHTLLFSHLLLVIHHGGVGIIGTCLKLRTSQIMVPILEKSDQYDNAMAIQASGLGSILTKEYLFPDEFQIGNLYDASNFVKNLIKEIINSNKIKLNCHEISSKLLEESERSGVDKILFDLNL